MQRRQGCRYKAISPWGSDADRGAPKGAEHAEPGKSDLERADQPQCAPALSSQLGLAKVKCQTEYIQNGKM